ncbi:hypothetical protein [Deinococcus aluminii]|uniref:Uncharacterized protein n=1 Tax=Deinococcus aluminii TaxID=1656885 RepID=A0ABP9X9Z1_9DEIO
MNLAFRDAVAETLPSEARLRARLAALPEREWEDLAGLFAATLPEVDVLLALPEGLSLARAIARARGLPVLDALSPNGTGEAAGAAEAVLVSGHLTGGLPEMEALLRAERRGLRVPVVIAAIERTNDRGRTRLELQAVRVQAAVRLADTPEGLAFERRTPRRWPKVS